MKSNRRVFKLMFLTALALLLLAACQNEDETTADSVPPAATVDVDTVSVATGVGFVSAEGVVEPLRSAGLSFQTGGTVAEILIPAGTAVAEGDPILRLEAALQESALAQAEAGLVAAQANLAAAEAQLAVLESGVARADAGVKVAEAQLELVRVGARTEEVAAAEQNLAAAEAGVVQAAGNRDAALNVSDARIQAAQAQLAAAQAEVEPLEDSYQRILDACFETPDGGEVCPLYGPVEESVRFQLETARANLEAARAAVDEARSGPTPAQQGAANAVVALAVAQRNVSQAQLDLLQAGATEELIRQAEVGVAQALLGVEQAQVAISQAETAVTQAQAGVVNAEAAVAAAQKNVDRMTVRAPFAGVVSDITVEVGELVAPGNPVVRLADFGGWLVKTTDLTELDVVAVKRDLPAEVTIDALPGERLTGVVTDIATVSQLTRGDVTYEVTIVLDDVGDLPLRWGMTAFVDIDVE